jgi:uncharacterized protein
MQTAFLHGQSWRQGFEHDMPSKIDTYAIALRAAKRRKPDLDQAFRLLSKAHKHGDARATYALATWYLHGKHVARNLRTAIALLRAAAAGDVPGALFDLAVSYEKGLGAAKNERKAAELYLRSALAGATAAYYEVGRCYYHGIGVERDRRVAKAWLDSAADKKGPAPEE